MNVRRRLEALQLVPLAPEHLDHVVRVEQETFASPWSRAAFVRELPKGNAGAVVAKARGVWEGLRAPLPAPPPALQLPTNN